MYEKYKDILALSVSILLSQTFYFHITFSINNIFKTCKRKRNKRNYSDRVQGTALFGTSVLVWLSVSLKCEMKLHQTEPQMSEKKLEMWAVTTIFFFFFCLVILRCGQACASWEGCGWWWMDTSWKSWGSCQSVSITAETLWDPVQAWHMLGQTQITGSSGTARREKTLFATERRDKALRSFFNTSD